MIHEFSRMEMLIGAEGTDTLAHSRILVFGIGGVGSHAVEALARAGVGCLILVDSDTVSLTNINRQSIAYHSTMGQYKTRVMKRRIADINPRAQVITVESFVLPDNLEQVFEAAGGPLSYILDAVDTVTAKLAIASYGYEHSIPVISSMGTGNKLHPELFEITDIYRTSICPLCKVMRRELKARQIPGLKVCYSREQPLQPLPSGKEAQGRRQTPGSISFVPPAAGLMIAGQIVRDILRV